MKPGPAAGTVANPVAIYATGPGTAVWVISVGRGTRDDRPAPRQMTSTARRSPCRRRSGSPIRPLNPPAAASAALRKPQVPPSVSAERHRDVVGNVDH